MFTLIAENKYGEQMELTHNEAYVISNIDGLDPPDAVINTTRNASADGSVYNSSYVDNRVITITLFINGPAETNRINLYRYFKAKYKVRLYYQNGTRNVFIDGYVQNIAIEFFDKKQVAQITIFCPNPFFNGTNDNIVNFETITDLFEFPFSIEESKNLLPNNMTSQTLSGITFTVNSDGTIAASGTSSDYTWGAYVCENLILQPGSYELLGCPSGGSSTRYRLQVLSGNPSSPDLTVNDYGSGAEFTLTEATTISVRMLIKGSINATFSPMIQLSSIADTTYQQYGNPPGAIEFSSLETENETDIINGGDVETGVLIILRASGTVVNPQIYNEDSGEYFKLDITMNDGDVITINTRKKEKSVTLTSGGTDSNIIGNMVYGSSWFQLMPGDNMFIVTADTMPENLYCTFTIVNQFEGV